MASLDLVDLDNSSILSKDVQTLNTREDCDFYGDAAKYWKGVPATVDGMLGGFGQLSNTDAASSRKFIQPFMKGLNPLVRPDRALDCGAGIGRVTKRVLLPMFSQVDLVEQNQAFLEKARTYLGEGSQRVGQYYGIGLQDFTPKEGYYDAIWCQWVLSHLTNDDLVSFMHRCVKGLSPRGGMIFVKENIASELDEFDEVDSSVTRCIESLLMLFDKAGLDVLDQKDQEKFPEQLYKVTMFALRPR